MACAELQLLFIEGNHLIRTTRERRPSFSFSCPLSLIPRDRCNVSILKQFESVTNILELCNCGLKSEQLLTCDHLMYSNNEYPKGRQCRSRVFNEPDVAKMGLRETPKSSSSLPIDSQARKARPTSLLELNTFSLRTKAQKQCKNSLLDHLH